jgi:hypothetical protein
MYFTKLALVESILAIALVEDTRDGWEEAAIEENLRGKGGLLIPYPMHQ